MPSAPSGDALCHLRRTVASSSRPGFFPTSRLRSPLGLPAIDAALQGGLARRRPARAGPGGPAQLGAAAGFALALAALATAGGRTALWIQTDFAALEAGMPYGPGLDLFGLPMERLLILRVARPLDVLWAFEEALKSRALAAVLAELPETGAAADLTATRRLSLAARAGGGLGLLLRHRPSPLAKRGHDALGGRRRAEHARPLRRARAHRLRSLAQPEPARPLRPLDHVCWDHDERIFVPQALSLGVAATAGDRSV